MTKKGILFPFRFPSWGLWLPGSSPGKIEAQCCTTRDNNATNLNIHTCFSKGSSMLEDQNYLYIKLIAILILYTILSLLIIKYYKWTGNAQSKTLHPASHVLNKFYFCPFKFPSWLGIQLFMNSSLKMLIIIKLLFIKIIYLVIAKGFGLPNGHLESETPIQLLLNWYLGSKL